LFQEYLTIYIISIFLKKELIYLAIFVFGSYFYHSGIYFHSKFFISYANKNGFESFA